MIDSRQNEFSGDLNYEKQGIIRKKDWGILLIVGLIVTGIVTGITYSGMYLMAVSYIIANKLFHFIQLICIRYIIYYITFQNAKCACFKFRSQKTTRGAAN